jgi:hypothetical protein
VGQRGLMAMQHFLQEALASMQTLGGAATSALRAR